METQFLRHEFSEENEITEIEKEQFGPNHTEIVTIHGESTCLR